MRIFIAVARQEHFTRAAEKLGLSQSSVSSAVATLEQDLRVTLFDRSRRHVELTAAGNVLLAEAERILGAVELALRRMDDLVELRTGKLALAASQTVANYWLPDRLIHFKARYPGVEIDLWHGNSTQAEKRVATGRADLAIIEQEPTDPTLVVEPVGRDLLILVVGPHHPWFARGSVGWPDLRSSTWIAREQGSGTRALFEAALSRNGVSPADLDISLVLKSGEAVRHAVQVGTSAAVLSELVARAGLDCGLLRRVAPLAIGRHFNAVTPADRPPTKALSTFLDHLRTTAQA
nr:LysR substrate-binding domain-containing protein [Chthonobacter rhizosphaerae]